MVGFIDKLNIDFNRDYEDLRGRGHGRHKSNIT